MISIIGIGPGEKETDNTACDRGTKKQRGSCRIHFIYRYNQRFD